MMVAMYALMIAVIRFFSIGALAVQVFPQVSVNEVLQERVPQELFQGRIVLVGSQAISVKDDFITSCSQGTGSTPTSMSGVEIQAHLASQIISNVLEGRSLIHVWSESKEYLWLVFWIATVAVWGCQQQKTR